MKCRVKLSDDDCEERVVKLDHIVTTENLEEYLIDKSFVVLPILGGGSFVFKKESIIHLETWIEDDSVEE